MKIVRELLLLIAIAALWPLNAQAALALDGSTGVQTGATVSNVTLTLSTTNTPDLIIVGGVFVGSTGVASVTSAHLTFTRRVNQSGSDEMEEWAAVSSGALSSEVITVTFNVNASFVSATAFGISGANTSTKWDGNASIPYAATTAADPVVSTTNANDIIFGFMRFSSAGTPTAGAGWTGIYNPASGFFLAEYKIFSSAQSSVTVAVGTGSNGENGAIADAVIQSGGGSSCTNTGYTSTGAIAVPTASSTSVWLQSGAFGTTDCSATKYWQIPGGAFGAN